VWLLCTGVFGAYPSADDVRGAVRYLQLNSPAAAGGWLLDRARVVQAEIADERWRMLEQEVRARAAGGQAESGARTVRARARAAAVYLAVRVPALRNAFLVGQRRVRSARNRALTLGHVVRGNLEARTSGAQTLPSGQGADPALREFRVVTDRVVVDVDHSARHDLHTGIQQVVRRTVPLWDRDHRILAVAWTEDRSAFRTLTGPERQRALHRGTYPEAVAELPPKVVIPWRTVVVLPETPPYLASGRLAALAQYSGNTVVAVGYDCIPVISADLVPASEPQRFARYLTVLKHARRIAGVSRSAASEFAGFAAALPAQGLPGPTVVSCVLPAGPLPSTGPPARAADPPLVVCVGSLEPRKNHLALLYAAERLWREGLRFELLLIAGSGWGDEIPAAINRLQEAGRLITIRHSVTDSDLGTAYRRARFTVLPSLHEGYGLPVAESLAWGTPVITTNYGSTREVAGAGGALLIDPRDDEALVQAMRRLLTDDDLLRRLEDQARSRPVRTWEDYAADLWDCLVRPARPTGTCAASP
jgi:glycosyltransferase involved in cell wall biosynthesis